MVRIFLTGVVLTLGVGAPQAAELPYRVLSVSSVSTPADKQPAGEFVVQAGHGGNVRGLAFSPDGTLLATVSNDATVKLWDIRMGREVRTLTGAFRPLYTVAFSHDGKQVAAGGADQAIYLWNVADGRRGATLKGHEGWVLEVSFSPTGTMLASAGKDKRVVLWDLESGVPQAVLPHDQGVTHLAWSPDGKTLAAFHGTKAQRWDGARKRWVRAREFEDRNAVTRVQLWEAATGKALPALAFPADEIGEQKGKPADVDEFRESLGFSPDGKYLAATNSRLTYLFDRAGGKVVRVWPGVFLGFRRRDDALCLLERVGTLAFFDPATGRVRGRLVTPGAPDANTFHEARKKDASTAWDAPNERGVFSPDGSLLACVVKTSRVDRVEIWDARNGGRVQSLHGRLGTNSYREYGNMMRPLTVAWSPAEPVLAVAGQDVVRLVDLRKGIAPRVLVHGNGLIEALAFRRDGQVLASGNGRGEIKLWDTATGNLQLALNANDLGGWGVASLAFTPSGNALVSGHWFDANGDSRIIIWDAGTGKRLHVLRDRGPGKSAKGVLARGGKISGLAFLNDSLFFSTESYANRLSMWDVKTGKHLSASVVNPTAINGLACSPDERGFAIAGGVHKATILKENEEPDNAVRLYQVQHSGKLQCFPLRGHSQMVLSVAYSPDSALLASGSSDTTIKLWHPGKKTLLATLAGHTADVGALAFSHDGRLLASAGYDQTVCLWDVHERKLVAGFVAFGQDEFVMVTPDNYYTSSRQGLKGVAFRLGNRAIPFEQLDLRLNRPDVVLQRLGYAPTELVQSYRRAYDKRLRRMKVEEKTLKADFQLPALKLLAAPPLSTTTRRLTLRLRTGDAHARLDRLLAFVNDVPVWGAAGVDLRPLKASAAELEVAIDLSAGANKVQLAVRNRQGTESLQQTFDIAYQAPARKPSLYVLAVGVSRYQNEGLNLEYAAKDAKDMAVFFTRKPGRFGAVKVLPLLDRKATRDNILKAKSFLQQSAIDDQVVVFLAGHGLLDARGDYYFGTTDIDLKDLARHGLVYDEIEDLLDRIPARHKLLLMDTCHSGELDPEEEAPKKGKEPVSPKKVAALAPQVHRVRSFRGLVVLDAPEKPLGSVAARGLLNELFADLRRGSGAMVIASAGGSEFALESARWNNGVFTHAVLEGLNDRKADLNGDGVIRVSELRDYVTRRVQELTGGRQTPAARRENLAIDFPVD